MKSDLLIIAYFMNENAWNGANKSSFIRLLYFSAALSPIFLPKEDWVYSFSNTLFGPYNNDISVQMNELHGKELFFLEERKIYKNRIEDRYSISNKGIKLCESSLFKLDPLKHKIIWFKILMKTLSIYGEDFLSILAKEDPNVYYQNKLNQRTKLITDESEKNFSKEFFNFIKTKGRNELSLKLKNDQEYLLLFFDVLYRKYKGGLD